MPHSQAPDGMKRDIDPLAAPSEPDIKRSRQTSTSWFGLPPRLVEVHGTGGSQTFHLPQGILDKIPYFQSQQQRWADADAPLKLELPSGLAAADFALLLEQMLSRMTSKQPSDLQEALQLCQLASQPFVAGCVCVAQRSEGFLPQASVTHRY